MPLMKLGVLFSGGKDSVFACWRAMEKNDVACLITLVSENPDSYMFHTPNIARTGMQAEAMGIPLLTWTTRGVKEEELTDLEAAIAAARQRYDIQGIVTGAIESVYQAARVQRICRSQNLWCFNPLWQTDQIGYLRLLLREGFSVVISGVFAYPFDASWLGATLTEERIRMLEQLEKKYKINPSGEGGELETFVLDAPFWRKRIEIFKTSSSYANYRGRYAIEEMHLAEKTARMLHADSSDRAIGLPVNASPPGNAGGASQKTVPSNGCTLLIDLCFEKDSLSHYEFVLPIRDALQRAGANCDVRHYDEFASREIARYDRFVLCGTALQDNEYAEHLQHFSWITECRKPILGICAGMQVIGAAYGGSIVPNQAIGLEEIEIVRASPLLGEPRLIEGYHLHNYAVTLPQELSLLAGRAEAAEAFQRGADPVYGIIFHPEVRNRWILERFARLQNGRKLISFETDLCNELSH
ncbi:MAG: GMP synthase (glutamine-hydrolyzing) subunit A [Methanosaeta sp. PtaU1.Bin112]|nr:MAG: GMP synthase (glutamine-hydrolyzing) subunit A [Methanosaeta sp. PtaU1.Bin112]